jgi:hypothetical protein
MNPTFVILILLTTLIVDPRNMPVDGEDVSTDVSNAMSCRLQTKKKADLAIGFSGGGLTLNVLTCYGV